MITTTQQRIANVNYSFPFELPTFFNVSISDRRDSSYVMEASGENEGEETAIDTCDLMIKRISNVMVWDADSKRWLMRQIRYLKGCSTIWVHEQEEMKFAAINPAGNAIFLKSGGLSFTVEGDNIQKAMFLMLHENNVSFEEIENRFKRPDGALDRFFIIQDEVKAEKQITGYFIYELEAKKYLNQLIQSTRGGEVVYHQDRMEFLAKLFNLPAFENGYGAEVFTALLEKVNSDPKVFMETVGRFESVVEADVKRAIAAGIIEFSETAASFVQSGKVIVAFDRARTTRSEKEKEVIDFMLNPQNRQWYETLRGQTLAGLAKSVDIIED